MQFVVATLFCFHLSTHMLCKEKSLLCDEVMRPQGILCKRWPWESLLDFNKTVFQGSADILNHTWTTFWTAVQLVHRKITTLFCCVIFTFCVNVLKNKKKKKCCRCVTSLKHIKKWSIFPFWKGKWRKSNTLPTNRVTSLIQSVSHSVSDFCDCRASPLRSSQFKAVRYTDFKFVNKRALLSNW